MKLVVALRRPLLAAATLGLLALAAPVRADALAEARAALAAGDFDTMKARLDTHLAANPASDDARVLRALARLALAAEGELPAFLRNRLGANVAEFDLASGDLAVRFPRPFGEFPATPFTVSGPAFHEHGPSFDIYTQPPVADPRQGLPQPSITFRNTGAVAHDLTFTLSQPTEAPFYEVALYLDGQLLGFALATPGFSTEVFRLNEFERLPPNIPEPLDLRRSTPGYYLRPGPPGEFTLRLPPGAAFTAGINYSTGQLRLTPASAPPAGVTTHNGRFGGINPPRLSPTANFTDLIAFAGTLETSTLAPTIADLSVVSEDVSLRLVPAETGHVRDTVIAHPDVQLLLAELKFAQALRRLSTSYNFSQKITPSIFESTLPQILAKNPKFLTPLPPSRARADDRRLALALLEEATDHYQIASDSGLWSRPAPDSASYLFSLASEDAEANELQKSLIDGFLAQFAYALADSLPLEDRPGGPAINLAPFFGSPAVNVRGILPLPGPGGGFVRGSSTALLASGLITNLGTAAWEDLLARNGLLDLTTPPVQAPARIQRQPSALVTVTEGEPALLQIVAESFPPPAYQWFRGSGKTAVAVPDATGPTLFFAQSARTDAGRYFVRVTNERIIPPRTTPTITSVNSRPTFLQVNYAPEIDPASLADITRYQGRTIALSVAAVGVPAPRYQWFRDDVAITPPRTTPKLSFTATPARAGVYHVVATNALGSAVSEPVTVDVQTKPVFTLQPVGQTVVAGGSVTFTVAATGNPEPSIKWRKNGKDIPDATGPSYTIPIVELADRAAYSALAFSTVQTGPASTTIAATPSKPARLTVTAAPAP
jgi:hypothetical protein